MDTAWSARSGEMTHTGPVPPLLPLVEEGRERPPSAWRQPWRWVRWLLTGALSAATPLPWLVDVTASRTTKLELRVAHLEREVARLRMLGGLHDRVDD